MIKNTYFLGQTNADVTNTQNVSMFYAPNITASTNPVLKMHHSVSEVFSNVWAMECTNAALSNAVDVSTGHNAASNTITAGSVTPGSTNDLVVQSYWNDYTLTPVTGITAGSQSNITWALAQADLATNIGGQWNSCVDFRAESNDVTDLRYYGL